MTSNPWGILLHFLCLLSPSEHRWRETPPFLAFFTLLFLFFFEDSASFSLPLLACQRLILNYIEQNQLSSCSHCSLFFFINLPLCPWAFCRQERPLNWGQKADQADHTINHVPVYPNGNKPLGQLRMWTVLNGSLCWIVLLPCPFQPWERMEQIRSFFNIQYIRTKCVLKRNNACVSVSQEQLRSQDQIIILQKEQERLLQVPS